jgi:DHA1 family multidrug resistance protein-like MFS transporter
MNWRRNLTILSMAVFLAAIAFSLYAPFLPMFLQELGLKENISGWSGLMQAANSLTYALMAPVWGMLADRHGKRVMFMRSGFGIALTYVLMAVSHNHYQVFAWRALNGLLSGFIPSAILLVATNTPEVHLGFALGIIQTANSIGTIMGPMIGGVSANLFGVRSTLFASAAVLALAAVCAYYGTREEIRPQQRKSTFLTDMRQVTSNGALRIIMISQLLINTALMVIQPTLPLFVGEIVTTNVAMFTGVIFSIIGVSTALGAPLFGKIKNLNYQGLYVLGIGSGAILSITQGLTRSVWLLGGERFLFGFANAAMLVGGNVLLTQYSNPEERGRIFGVFNGIASLGSVAGPLLGGFLGDRLGLASPFYGSAILLLVAGWFVWTGLNARQALLETQAAMWWHRLHDRAHSHSHNHSHRHLFHKE